jgi:hypothetical protein
LTPLTVKVFARLGPMPFKYWMEVVCMRGIIL